ncbi:MAG TPA: IPT/TIG domain-containing protein, partial [Acidimicrobiales bacterium]|nr:IPT/TIG domain-containing protein [Acidimicrobiales bacterium]
MLGTTGDSMSEEKRMVHSHSGPSWKVPFSAKVWSGCKALVFSVISVFLIAMSVPALAASASPAIPGLASSGSSGLGTTTSLLSQSKSLHGSSNTATGSPVTSLAPGNVSAPNALPSKMNPKSTLTLCPQSSVTGSSVTIPTITSVSPTIGTSAGGTVITITGFNFQECETFSQTV